jgi:hypothetical protein
MLKMLCTVSEPYTHAAHAQRCHAAALAGDVLSNQYVQVKKGQIVFCAHLKAAWTVPVKDLDCWTVETFWPEQARFTTPCKNVRLCGDEKCSCIAEDAARRERFSAALAPTATDPESM